MLLFAVLPLPLPLLGPLPINYLLTGSWYKVKKSLSIDELKAQLVAAFGNQ